MITDRYGNQEPNLLNPILAGVLLASEELDEYDVEFYRELVIRAAASVLSPLRWRESGIEEELEQYTESSLLSF